MKDFSLYLFLLFCFTFLGTNAAAQSITDSASLESSLAAVTDAPVITEINTDSLKYVYRLDSLNSEIPLVYNPQVQKYIGVYTGSRKREFSNMLEQSKYYFPIFEKALKAYNIPDAFKYLPVIESAMNASAVSKSGATGMWQFMYTTGKGYRLIMDEYVDERKDPIQASYAAAKYLRDAYNSLGDWILALAAYNCGAGAVKRAIVKAGGERDFWQLQSFLPGETQRYIPAFIAATYVMSYPNHHNLIAANNGVCHLTDSVYVNRFINLNELSSKLNLQANQLSKLNPCYKKGIVNGSTDKPKRLIIPQLNTAMYASLYNELNKTKAPTVEIKIEKEPIEEPTAEPEVETVASINEVKQPAALSYNTTTASVTTYPIKSLSNPSPSYINYTVKMGDTLLAIASRFKGLTVDRIKELNQLSNSMLKIGSILKLVTINY